MKLTPENIYQYLHKRQLIDGASVIKGHFAVHPVTTRNNIMKIVVQPENSLFVKQAENDIMSRSMFLREVYTNKALKARPEFAAIAGLVPAMIDHDDEENVIVSELWPNAKNLSEHYWITKKFDTDLARGQAYILAACHTKPRLDTDTLLFPKKVPWIMQLHEFEANEFFTDTASTEIISLVKENPLLRQELISLGQSWNTTHLIHGDIKWINFLIAESEGETKQTLIDWELADIGDPIWDVAGLLQSYVAAWVMALDNSRPGHYQLPEQLAHYEISNMQPSAKAFLEEYLVLQEYPEDTHEAFYKRAIQFTAARIIQTSFESTVHYTHIEANNIRLIQLAFNMLTSPEACLEELFDIKLQPAYV